MARLLIVLLVAQLAVASAAHAGASLAVSSPALLGGGAGIGGGEIAVNPGGDAFVAFGNDRGVYVVRRPPGGAWSAPQPVAYVGQVGGPVIAKGSRPGALLWTTFNTDPYRVQLAPVLVDGELRTRGDAADPGVCGNQPDA